MPRPPKIYNTNLKVPAEIVAFHIETGESRPYNIYKEVGTGKELLKCDLCGLFLTLKARSPIMLSNIGGGVNVKKWSKSSSLDHSLTPFQKPAIYQRVSQLHNCEYRNINSAMYFDFFRSWGINKSDTSSP